MAFIPSMEVITLLTFSNPYILKPYRPNLQNNTRACKMFTEKQSNNTTEREEVE